MSQVKEVVIRFRQSSSPDVVANRVYVLPANSPHDPAAPFDEIRPPPAPNSDGYTRIAAADVSRMQGIEGQFDVHVTALDARGNESDPLEIDNQTFDLSPPEAPTDGATE